MKMTILNAALLASLVAAPAVASQIDVPVKGLGHGLATNSTVSAEDASAAGVDVSRLSSERVMNTYRVVDAPAGDKLALSAGMTLYNEVLRTTGQVTGNITVLADGVDISQVANQFGLRVVYQDTVSGIGQLNAAGHDNLLALVEELQASDLVRAARLDIIERRFEPGA